MKPDPDAVLFVSRTQYTLQLGAGNVRQQNKLTIVTSIWNVLTVPPSWLCREVWNGCFFFVEVVPRNADSGMREIYACGIWSPGLWNPEYS